VPRELPPLERIRHVHLIAIAGTGMGALACMLRARGFEVTGSDQDIYPPMSDQLRDAGIPVARGFRAENVVARRPDLVVIGNAVRRENPEAVAAIEAGLPYTSMPDALRELFIRERHSVVIAGTHGKTTTTSLVGWVLVHAGRDPTILVGGVAENLGGGFRIGAGEHVVIEGDEYDTAFFEKTPKCWHYAARTLLFTSCEFDHADIYPSLDAVKAAFRGMVERIPADGRIVAAVDEAEVRDVLRAARAPVEGYGFTEAARFRASDVQFDARRTQFSVWRDRERVARVALPLHGRHNVENALGAFAVCLGLGVPAPQIAAALGEFKGVRRRQELRGVEGGVSVIDDFAHHPTAVRETIKAMRARFPGQRLVAVLEPRTNTSRRRFFEDAFVEALAGADAVVLAGVHRADQLAEEERLRPELVVERLNARGVPAVHLPDVDAIIEHLVETRAPGDVALVMSNGGFGGIWERLLERLRKVEG
jgi:UDP-N-acetylmuramate: L-alanyl-gamma-D-glutamyl-meso-diaminopimelate ligase